MPFTGTADVKRISADCVRITGLSLGSGASGTIGFPDAEVFPDPEVELPESMQWAPYNNGEGEVIDLSDAVQVTFEPVEDPFNGDVTNMLQRTFATKSGSDKSDFLVTITNALISESDTPELEITLKFQ